MILSTQAARGAQSDAPQPQHSHREPAPAGSRRARLPLALPARAAQALAAFCLFLTRHLGDDEVTVEVRTPGGDATLALDLSANVPVAALVARAEDALAEAGAPAFASGCAFEASAEGAGVALRVEGDEAAVLVDERYGSNEALRLVARLQVVCDALAESEERGILELPLLTPAERAERVRWNATDLDLPHGVCLHQAFEAHADANPHAIAVVYGDEEITYGEIESRANRLANHLRRRGVGPEHRVGICVERGPRVLEAILGVLKAGGAYVPLDATYPPERLAGMVRTAGIRVLVAEEATSAALEMAGERVLLDRDAALIAAESDARPEAKATPENLAYVIFTSGSTGEPKGIALAHRGVMNNLADLNGGHGVGPADRVLLLSSLSFDMSVYETLGILAAGGATVIPLAHELRDPAAWAALCRRHGVTLWNSAPALLGMLCDHAEAAPAEAPSGLRLAFLGGDWVPVPLVERVRAWAPGMRDFIVMGGATEASIHSIIFPVHQVDPAWRSIPYGVPMANQRAWVLDRHLREVPAGAAGELFLGGIGLARGYTGRPGFTAERFLPNPHGAPGNRLYRTGDRARYGEDGTIELLGRIDHQVKIRGFRIEPGEIEAALRRHPAVARAVVTARSEAGEQRLVAYVVRAEGAETPPALELREMLRASLPDYMVPSAYVVMDRLPLSPNGKVDRRQLPAPAAADERAAYVAPATPVEAVLAEIWAEVLGAERIGADDDFFALGGHSLTVTRVAARVRQRLGVQLPLGEFFRVPTLRGLAAAIAAEAGDAADDAIPTLEGDGPFPLSFAQERLWFLDRLQPDSAFYNIPSAVRLGGDLDVAALERALGEIVRRHPALRTVFRDQGGSPVQQVTPFDGFTLAVEDLSSADGELRDDEVRRRAAEEAARPFDLSEGPVFRARLLRLAADEHVLLLCLHHAAGDGWSLEVMFRELATLYAAFRDGGESPLPEPAVTYAEFAAWERAKATGPAFERELAWWRERLAGAPELLELPTDRPRPAVQSYRGARERFELPHALVERLGEVARAEGATLYMALLAAFQVLLAKHAGSDDIVVGSPIAGRTRAELEGVVGFFANTLALRTDLSGDPAFAEVLRRVREVTLGAYEHQDVPFDRLVEELRPGRGLDRTPLVQVGFALQNAGRSDATLPGLRAGAVEVETETAKFDLFLEMTPAAGGLRGELEYATDLFDAATLRRMAGRLVRLLEQVAGDAGARVSELEMMDAAERRAVVEEWNRTAVAYPAQAVHRVFEAQAARTPEATALLFGDEAVTYGEVNARANRLAHHLISLGVGMESRVAVCLERGPEMVISILAVLKAGGAYVPLDPGYPAERLAMMLRDSGVAVVVTQDSLRDVLPASDARVLSVDAARDAIAAESSADPASDVGPGGLAYVMYTSGSTGTPKGVAVEHRGIVRLVRGANFARLGPDETLSQIAPVSFDAATLEIWGALLNGGRLVLLPGRNPSLEEIGRALVRHGVTTFWITTALFRVMVQERLEDLAGLRQLITGGELLPADEAMAVRRRFPALRLMNAYGPTENTTFTTCQPLDAEWTGSPAAIGTPISNTTTYVLDAALRPVPAGIPGELYAGGHGVARGYLNRPALTAERFLPDPFATRPGSRMYRTGDRVRWTEVRKYESTEVRKYESTEVRKYEGTDGSSVLSYSRTPVLQFLGRADTQVKIRGFRIEPGEVEAVLARLAGVRECAVVAREDAPGERRLVAYVAGEAETDALAAGLRRSLPDYMVPAAFVRLAALPINGAGKVDRRALPAPEAESTAASHAAPRTPVEAVVAEIWAEVLGAGRIGIDENFFDLGGHSLQATRMVSRVAAALGVELSVRAVFESPTVAEMAARVEEIRLAGLPLLPAVTPAGRAGAMPLSFAQERLWFLHSLRPDSAFYNIPVVVRLTGALDVAALEHAIGETVRRHEVLRTTFRDQGGVPVQVVAPYSVVSLPVEDLSALPDTEREAAAERRAAEEAGRPFDLTAGPVLRPLLLKLGDEEHVLLLSMHHIVGDEWSLDVLFRDLAAFYAARQDGAEARLPALPVQYADYAAWQREQLQGEALERRLAWWTERLEGAPALLELPADHPRPAVQSFRGATVHATLPPTLGARLEALGRAEGATQYMVLLAAFQALLARYTGGTDIVVGSPFAGHTRREVEELVGFFANTLVLRTDLSGDPDFRVLLRRVREATLGAYEHQDVPFDRLVAELQPERDPSHTPLFQVSFVLADTSRPAAALPGVEMRRVFADSGTAKFDLSLMLAPGAGGIGATLTYSTDLFERPTAERMLAHLGRVLEQVAADATVRLSELELVGAGERRVVVEEWNRTERPFPRGATITGLFAERVAAAPDAVALVWGGEELTYAQLDARANRLAHHLVRHGVGAEARVGVLLERGTELIVSILAVLKAGGCYVPLDPAHPAARLEGMLADAGARVLLARGALAAGLGAPGVAVLALDGAAEAIAAESAGEPEPGPTDESLAYIVYTGGGSGQPRGVMVAHRHVVQLVRETDYVRLGPGDRVAQASNAGFDTLTFEAWGALLNGATLVGIDRDVLARPRALRRVLREEKITTLYQTTALLNQLAREQPDIFAPLREVLFGGQAADADSVRRILASGSPRRLLHMYGPAETTAWCSWEQVRELSDEALTVPLGGPTGNQRIYLLDDKLHPVPVGHPGEGYVGGDGVVRGYLDRPGLTAERFVPDPFSSVPGARMYRTGDRLRWKEVRDRVNAGAPSSRTAVLEFVGRVDGQVKIRGFRIEPAEVESALAAHPAVEEARVVVREDRGEKRLVAYVVGEVDGEALRAWLGRSVPEYMVPAVVVGMEALPLTPDGVLDVDALPAPELGGDGFAAPRTPVEEVLAGIFGEVLGVDRVGTGDDFFELGGHSLLATRVVSRIRAVLGVDVALRALFEAPTVARVAEAVESLRRDGAQAVAPVVAVERNGPLPLSFAQERLWFLHRLRPESAFYNIPAIVRLSGELDAGALGRALGEIVRRHEVLRTVFHEGADGHPVQVVAPFAGFTLATEDLSALPAPARRAVSELRAADEAARPFDLAAGPLFRPTLLRLAGDEHVLLLCMHHIVADEWSLQVLFRELSALYGAFSEGDASPLGDLPVQYADYAVWQRGQLRGETLDARVGWWKQRLAGAPALLELPTDRPRPAVQSFRGATASAALPAALRARLEALGRGEGATLYMVLLAAFQVLLGKYAGTDDVVVGSPVAGQTRREVEELVGFFANTLVLRADLSGDPAFREVLRRVRETTLGAYDHQDVPFERLVEALQPERSLSHSPLFQVAFVLAGEPRGEERLAGVAMHRVFAQGGTSKFDLALTVAPGPDGIGVSLEYATDLFEHGTAERMLGHFARLLEQVARDADRRLSALSLAGRAERKQVVKEWNATAAPVPAGATLHGLIEAQVERTPEAVAVRFEGDAVTYRELNARANRLAHRLIARGVGPETRVGLCLERSVEMVVAILAVLKAGGAYVPLDPGYPAERLAFMLADSAVPVLLTQERLRGAIPTRDGTEVITVDAMRGDDDAGAENPVSRITPGNLAYVIYTSGSTGRPKGAMNAHRGVVNRLEWMQGAFGLESADVVLQKTPFSFDVSVWEFFWPLQQGATLVMAKPDGHRDPAYLQEVIEREGVTTLHFVPPMLQHFVEMVDASRCASLKRVVCSGEALPPALVEQFHDRFPSAVSLHNLYGPTEAAVDVSWWPCERGPAHVVPIGRPVWNTRLYVLDAGMQPVPVGVPGELFIGGSQVGRGYHGRAALTAEKFVPDAFGLPGARLYRTGDKARWRPDGALEYLGRLDEQVKIRGFRIELGEIEAALRAVAGVREATVIVREDIPGDRRLVAYVVGDADADRLREQLRRGLPEHMVPAAFVGMDALPLTPNGKLDRRALPAPEYRSADDDFIAPRNPVEEILAGIWAELLRLERVGVTENFFAIGGHSLLATRVVSRVREALEGEVGIATLFARPTIEELAPLLSVRQPDAPAAGMADGAAMGAASSTESLLAAIDDLSEEELDRLLGEISEIPVFE